MSEKLFDLQSKYKPSPDQANAITQICDFIDKGHKFQTLW